MKILRTASLGSNFTKETQTISIYLFYLLSSHEDTSTKPK